MIQVARGGSFTAPEGCQYSATTGSGYIWQVTDNQGATVGQVVATSFHIYHPNGWNVSGTPATLTMVNPPPIPPSGVLSITVSVPLSAALGTYQAQWLGDNVGQGAGQVPFQVI